MEVPFGVLTGLPRQLRDPVLFAVPFVLLLLIVGPPGWQPAVRDDRTAAPPAVAT